MLLIERPKFITPKVQTLDSFQTFNVKTRDSTGAFLVGELERLDQKLHEPLVTVTWSRDIDLRTDVSMADEVSSFTNSSFAAAGGFTPNGKSWVGKGANAISSMALDIGKTTNPLFLWGQEISFTIPELESAQRLGRPIDVQKFNAMKLKHQMDIDEQVYIGDTTLGVYGLFNSPLVTNVSAVANNGTANHYIWASKTADQILADVNTLLTSVWTASGYAIMPSKLLLPPPQFGYLVSQKVSSAGTLSILQFLKDNSLCNAANNRPLDIQPCKWLVGRGNGIPSSTETNGTAYTDRMVAYTQDEDRVRFPLVPLQRTPVEYRSLYQLTTYFGRLGVIEFVYPETIGYADGI